MIDWREGRAAALRFLAFIVVVAAIILFIAVAAKAHEAVSGWTYPIECCAGYDCAEIDSERVRIGATGYVIDGKFALPYSEARQSPDGKYHACFPTPDNLKCFWAPPFGS